MRPMSKSAVRVAREALAVGWMALPPYASRYSKHTYTQPQLFALLALKQFLKTDSRFRRRAWPKLTAVVHVGSHLIVGAVTGRGPTQDSPEFTPAMRQAAGVLRFDTVLADAGYDAEHNHRLCREALDVRQTVINLNPRNTGRRWPMTPYRREMRRRFPRALYHQRWHAESAFSRHKRRLGSALTARCTASQQRELVLRVLTHNLMLLRCGPTGFQQSIRGSNARVQLRGRRAGALQPVTNDARPCQLQRFVSRRFADTSLLLLRENRVAEVYGLVVALVSVVLSVAGDVHAHLEMATDVRRQHASRVRRLVSPVDGEIAPDCVSEPHGLSEWITGGHHVVDLISGAEDHTGGYGIAQR